MVYILGYFRITMVYASTLSFNARGVECGIVPSFALAGDFFPQIFLSCCLLVSYSR